MRTARDHISKIRSSMGTVVMPQASAGRRAADGVINARAHLARAEITEKYFVTQGISKNPSIEGGPPTGLIELAIPYDGYEYFTREAIEDVKLAARGQAKPSDTAVVGQLQLHDYDRTSLPDGLQLRDKDGRIPIEAQLTPDGDEALGYLSADRHTCVTRYEYEPDPPGEYPAELDIQLFDPDSLDLPDLDLMGIDPSAQEHRRRAFDVVKAIRQQVSFQNELVLRVVVSLNLPVKKSQQDIPKNARPHVPKPLVTKMSIGWPTITSLRTLDLRIVDSQVGGPNVIYDTDINDDPLINVRYNPISKCLEWGNVRMTLRLRTERDAAVDILEYESPAMLLAIRHPGELYKQPELEARADVEIPRYSLSGLTASLYEATGETLQMRQPELTTHVRAEAKLTLNDAFAKRQRSPCQHLVFDEIIPDEMRITDIITALKDRGFDVKRIWPAEQQSPIGHMPGSDTLTWLLAAQRREGPDTMNLWIFVEGRQFETERETTAFGGGVTHKTKLTSGELRVFIRGTLARESKKLTHEMNALHQALRDRYERVRQRR